MLFANKPYSLKKNFETALLGSTRSINGYVSKEFLNIFEKVSQIQFNIN